eukprot:TRINITY_DN106434_c0_g1_i1.p1 TRINITY_DN106434_c0_g1~~TRINITY_DN106434_c0_g1_i1.p1  ORF type:complete len:232 (-),score=38.38 TRINITY_DN106434_c0_g1_i1:219-872(-)
MRITFALALSFAAASGKGYEQYMHDYDASGEGPKVMKVSPDDTSERAATGTWYIKKYANGWDDNSFDAKSNGVAYTHEYAGDAVQPGPQIMHKGDEARQDGTKERAEYTDKPFAKDMEQGIEDAKRYETLFWPQNDSAACFPTLSTSSSKVSDTGRASSLATALVPDFRALPNSYQVGGLVCFALSICVMVLAILNCEAFSRSREFQLANQSPLLAA